MQSETFVCQHVVESLHTKVAVGFHWSREDASSYPDAWCAACETARLEGGGEGTDELMNMVRLRILCGACYLNAKQIWLGARRRELNLSI